MPSPRYASQRQYYVCWEFDGEQKFFIINSADRLKAHSIAWSLKEAGHEVAVHDWEIPAGGNAPLWMNAKLAWADRLIAPARYSPMEWASQLWDDQTAREAHSFL
jgi:hypothetical protein